MIKKRVIFNPPCINMILRATISAVATPFIKKQRGGTTTNIALGTESNIQKVNLRNIFMLNHSVFKEQPVTIVLQLLNR